VLVVAATAVTALAGAPAHAAPAASRAAFTTAKAAWTNGSPESAAQATDKAASYWTAERMRDAVPAEPPANATSSAVTPKPTGRPGSTNAIAPTAGIAPLGVGVPKSTTVGKVFAHNPITNEDYACSASTVGSPSMMLVLTAAHCVHGGRGGTWATNWVFVPMYSNGTRPYGTWAAKYYTAFNEWQNDSNLDRDVAFVTMWPNAAGQRIVNVVGGNGLSWNQAYEQHVTILGYPAAAPFIGDTQESAVATTFRIGTWPFQENTVATICNLTGGASGGPWLRDYTGGVALVNGVMSTKQASICRSPYFDSAVFDLYQNIASSV
jgi:V8-like Glu-specific endopeptidase